MLSLVGLGITRQTTSFCQLIEADERLAITLWFLVTSDSIQTISFNYRVGHSTVCSIIAMLCGMCYLVNILEDHKQQKNG